MSRHGERSIVIDVVLARTQGMQVAVVPRFAAVDFDLMMLLPRERDPCVDGVERRIRHFVVLRCQHRCCRVFLFPAHRVRRRRRCQRCPLIAQRLHGPVEFVGRSVRRKRQVQPCRIDLLHDRQHGHGRARRAAQDAHGIAHRRRVGLPLQEDGIRGLLGRRHRRYGRGLRRPLLHGCDLRGYFLHGALRLSRRLRRMAQYLPRGCIHRQHRTYDKNGKEHSHAPSEHPHPHLVLFHISDVRFPNRLARGG